MLVRDQLIKHNTYDSLLDEEGRRCWTLQYRENGSKNEKYHMDILPAVNTEGHTIILEKAFSDLKNGNYDNLHILYTLDARIKNVRLKSIA